MSRRTVRRGLTIALVVIAGAGVPALLAVRHSAVPVVAWSERQWVTGEEDGPALRQELTGHPRIESSRDAVLARPGGVTVEWRAFLLLREGGPLGLRTVSGGPVEVRVAGSVVARRDAPGEDQAWQRLDAGTHEIVVRVTVPDSGGFFRGGLSFPDGRVVRLEDAKVTPRAITLGQAELAERVRRLVDPALVALAVVALLGLALLLRSSHPRDRLVAESAATVLVLAIALLLPHGPGLALWGTAFWGGVGTPARAVLLLAGLVPWVLARAGRPVALPGGTWLARPWVAAPVALVVTWLLREARIWGDGWITLAILEGRDAAGPFGPFFWKEPLDRIVAVGVVGVAERLGRGAADAVALTSCLAGAWAAWTLARARARGDAIGWETGAVWTAGGAVLFFGHVENYSWVSAALLAFLLAAMRAAAGRGQLATGALAGLAVAFHPVAAFQVVPVLAVLVFLPGEAHDARLARALRLLAAALVVPALLLAGALVSGIPLPGLGLNRFADDPHVLLAPAQAFAPANVALFLNRLTLILSPGIALALIAGLVRATRPSPGALVALAAATGALLQLALLHGKIRPAVQDWDLYAPAFVPLALLAGRALAGVDDRPTRAWAFGVSGALLLGGLLGGR